MSKDGRQDIEQELAYQSQQAALEGQVLPTPKEVVQRFAETRRWKTNPREFVFKTIRDLQPAHICDFGCGTGENTALFALLGYQVTGFDLSPEMIEMTKKRALLDGVQDKVEVRVADVTEAAFKDTRFDVVSVQLVLHHVVIHKALEQILSYVKPGGAVVIHEPSAFSPGLQKFRDAVPVPKNVSPNERQLDQHDIDLIRSGFDTVNIKYFYLLARLHRFVPKRFGKLKNRIVFLCERLDYWILKWFPFLRKFAGVVVMVCRPAEPQDVQPPMDAD